MDDHAALLRLAGHVKVELFDELTRKKVMETEGHNLFTDYGLSRFRIMSNYLIGTQFGSDQYGMGNAHSYNTGFAFDNYEFGFLKFLILTDNENAVAANTLLIPGNITGIGSRRYDLSTSNPKYGVQNNKETIFTEGKLKAVFDFATDRANGIHKSVFWSAEENNSIFDYSYSLDHSTYSNFILPSTYRNMVYSAFIDQAGYVYINFPNSSYPEFYNKVLKCDRNGNIVDTYTLTERPYNNSNNLFCIENNKLYYVSFSDAQKLCVFNLTNQTTEIITMNYSLTYFHSTVVNGVLYYGYSSSVVAFDLTTRTTTTKQVPISLAAMINRFGSLNLVSGYSIYSYDPAANTIGSLIGHIDDPNYVVDNLYNSDLVRKLLCYGFSGTTSISDMALKRIKIGDYRANVIAGKLLDAPVTKNNTQTMKVTYTITIT